MTTAWDKPAETANPPGTANPARSADSSGVRGMASDRGMASGGAPERERGAHRAAHREPTGYPATGGPAAAGFIVLAAVFMIMSGLWDFFIGVTAVLRGHFFVVVSNYTFHMNIHAWGWTHVIIGALVFAAGVCVLLGRTWARVLGVVLAAVSGIENFVFLPYYPTWSMIVIALDVLVIWALTTSYRRPIG
jgi:hypothetical protein